MQEIIEKGKSHHYMYEDLSLDLFTLIYEAEPKFVDAPCPVGLQVAKQAIEAIKELREYKELRQFSRLDPMLSGLACISLSDSFRSLLPPTGSKSPEDLQKEIDLCEELGKDDGVANAERALEKLNKLETAAGKISVNEDELRQKMRVVLGKAMSAAEEGEEACQAFGYGNEAGKGQQGNLKEKMALAKQVGNSKKLKEIAKLAGRFTRIAKKKQMEKMTAHEFSSIKTGDHLQRMLPSELAKLGNPITKGLFFKGFVEKTLLEYELGGKEPQGKGPIICEIDSSRSMAGAAEWASKGIAMALLSIAKKQKRDFILVQFGSRTEIRSFTALKGECEQLALLTELEWFFAGGTDFERPLNVAIDYIKQSKYKHADIVFITDGVCSISPEFEEMYKRVKKERQFACIGVLIGAHKDNAVMQKFCDESFNVSDLINDETNNQVHNKIFKV